MDCGIVGGQCRNEKSEAMKQGDKTADKNEQLSAAYHNGKAQPKANRADSPSDAKQDWKKLHESRTLDQFYYHSLKDTEGRDRDQVVTRYIDHMDKSDWKNPLDRNKQWDILRVDQLWLWIIDESTYMPAVLSLSTKGLGRDNYK